MTDPYILRAQQAERRLSEMEAWLEEQAKEADRISGDERYAPAQRTSAAARATAYRSCLGKLREER